MSRSRGGPPSRSQPPSQKGQGKGTGGPPKPKALPKNNQERLAHVLRTWGPQATKPPTRSEWICSGCFLGNFHSHASCRHCQGNQGWPAYYHMPATPNQWGNPMATDVILSTFPAKPGGDLRSRSVPPGGPPRAQTPTAVGPALPSSGSGMAPVPTPAANTDMDVDLSAGPAPAMGPPDPYDAFNMAQLKEEITKLEDLKHKLSGASLPMDALEARLQHLVQLMQARMPAGQQLDHALAVQRRAVQARDSLAKQATALREQLALLDPRLHTATLAVQQADTEVLRVRAELASQAPSAQSGPAPAPSAALEQARDSILSALSTHAVDPSTTAAVQTLVTQTFSGLWNTLTNIPVPIPSPAQGPAPTGPVAPLPGPGSMDLNPANIATLPASDTQVAALQAAPLAAVSYTHLRAHETEADL
eukprot:5467181-Amphidinium_carterae.1